MPVTPDEFVRTDPFEVANTAEHIPDPVPVYEVRDPLDGLFAEELLHATADTLKLRAAELGLPLTTFPVPGNKYNWTEQEATRAKLIKALFLAVERHHDEMVTMLVSAGFVSPDVPRHDGATPLAIAVLDGSLPMVKLLLSIGAQIDGFSAYPDDDPLNRSVKTETVQRTPLMLAAHTGQLALVKLLLALGADDAIVAPDGQIALRLAAKAQQHDIVAVLPLRRAGALKRWQAANAKNLARARAALHMLYMFAKFFVYHIPKCFLWDLPRDVVVEPAIWVWKNKHKFPGWIANKVRGIPAALRRAARGMRKGATVLAKGLQKLPAAVLKVVKATPAVLVASAKRAVWAVKTAAAWVWDLVSRAARGVWRVVARVISAAHTVFLAIATRLRGVTLKNVRDAIVAVPRALFVTLPLYIWERLRTFWDMTLEVLVKTAGILGLLVWIIVRVIAFALWFIPQHLGKLVFHLAKIVGKAGEEVLVWLNPKRV